MEQENLSERLLAIADQIKKDGSCLSKVDKAVQVLSENKIWGYKRLTVEVEEDSFRRLNAGGNMMTVNNFHDVLGWEDEDIIFDVDSPKIVYSFEEYKRDCCFGDPVFFRRCEES